MPRNSSTKNENNCYLFINIKYILLSVTAICCGYLLHRYITYLWTYYYFYFLFCMLFFFFIFFFFILEEKEENRKLPFSIQQKLSQQQLPSSIQQDVDMDGSWCFFFDVRSLRCKNITKPDFVAVAFWF